MFYLFPKKIQYQPSQAKWSIQSTQSVLLIVGLDELRQHSEFRQSQLSDHLLQLVKKAKSLEIPIIELNTLEPQQGMMLLGQHLSPDTQLIIAGLVNSQFKQIIQYMGSITEQICVIDDAILLQSVEQHIQWINIITTQNIHHMNTRTANRLWALSAPTSLIMSSKGILFAIAEQLDMEPLEINPEIDLREYGLDSVAMVTLIGLWRVNGADISYEDFLEHHSLSKLLNFLL